MEMETENQVASAVTADTRGKHRILAELKRLEQETRSLEVFSLRSFFFSLIDFVNRLSANSKF